jgi:hypothetical protein
MDHEARPDVLEHATVIVSLVIGQERLDAMRAELQSAPPRRRAKAINLASKAAYFEMLAAGVPQATAAAGRVALVALLAVERKNSLAQKPVLLDVVRKPA